MRPQKNGHTIEDPEHAVPHAQDKICLDWPPQTAPFVILFRTAVSAVNQLDFKIPAPFYGEMYGLYSAPQLVFLQQLQTLSLQK